MHEIEKLADLMYCSPTIETFVGDWESFKEAAAYLISKGVAIPVRCKDCKYNVANMERDPLDKTDYTDIVCSYWMSDGLDENDFCSRGKRKEE